MRIRYVDYIFLDRLALRICLRRLTPGVCDDKIANDGFQKVCLKGPSLPLGLECSTDRQCFSQYCVPQSAPTEQKPLTCAERPDGKNTSTNGGDDPGTGETGTGGDTNTGGGATDNGGGSGSDNGVGGEVFTTVIVENGQTRTVIATRTVTVRGSSRASASTGGVSASTTGGVGANVSSTPSSAAIKLGTSGTGWFVGLFAAIAGLIL